MSLTVSIDDVAVASILVAGLIGAILWMLGGLFLESRMERAATYFMVGVGFFGLATLEMLPTMTRAFGIDPIGALALWLVAVAMCLVAVLGACLEVVAWVRGE